MYYNKLHAYSTYVRTRAVVFQHMPVVGVYLCMRIHVYVYGVWCVHRGTAMASALYTFYISLSASHK